MQSDAELVIVIQEFVVGDLAHCRGGETGWSLWSISTQAILWFCD